jgi:hypothetical protein
MLAPAHTITTDASSHATGARTHNYIQQGPVPAPGTDVLLDVAAAVSVCRFACTCAPGMSLAPGAEARAAVVAQLQAERTGRSGGRA